MLNRTLWILAQGCVIISLALIFMLLAQTMSHFIKHLRKGYVLICKTYGD